jgi:heme exporter protein A
MRLTGTDLTAIRGFKTIFTDLSFALEREGFLVVTGPNGVGKSTFLRIVAGLAPPASGKVRLEPESEDGYAHRIHYLGHLDGLKPTLTVEQNLDFWRRFWGTGDVFAALERLGIDHLAHLPVAVLSAGQKRRTAMARLLLAERPVWLLDEPLTALDSAAEEVFAGLLSDHLRAGGLAIAATHRTLPVEATAALRMEAA